MHFNHGFYITVIKDCDCGKTGENSFKIVTGEKRYCINHSVLGS